MTPAAQQTSAASLAPRRTGRPGPGRWPGSAWIRGAPRHIQVAGAIVLAFAVTVLALGAAVGAPLVIPDARVSIVLGINVALPLALAMSAYLFTQSFLILLRKTERSPGVILRTLGHDMILLGSFVLVTYLHFNLKMWIPLINPALYDAQYMVTDEHLRWLIDASAWASDAIHSVFSEEVRWYQFIFLSMFGFAFCRFSAVRHDDYPRFAVSMLLMISLGGLSYLIAPALGPFIYEGGSNSPAADAQAGMYAAYQEFKAEGPAWLERRGADYFTGALAAMPSLHVGYASLMTYYMLKSRDYLAPFFVLLWSWVLVDSVALRWHYIIDAPVGMMLSAFVIWLTYRLLPRRSCQPSSDAPALARPGYSAPEI